MTPDVSEADFQKAVIDLAKLRGWKCFHDNDSRRNEPGLPDLLLVRNGRMIWAELKSEKGRIRAEQSEWLHELLKVEHATAYSRAVQVIVWRPSDWPMIQELLR